MRITLAQGLLALAALLVILLLIVGGMKLRQQQPPIASNQAPISDEVSQYPITRVVRYRIRIQNPQTHPIDSADVYVLAPFLQGPTQQREEIRTEHPYEIESEASGNDWLKFTLKDLPPLGKRIITLTVRLSLSDTPNSQKLSDPERYLADESYIEVNDPILRQWAKQFQQENPHSTAESVMQAVRNNITYSGYIREPRGARYAFNEKRGDCTEYAYLFTALMRINGIPARPLRGYLMAQDGLLDPAEVHDWSEYYHEGRWHLADPQRGILRKDSAHYIAMRVVDYRPTEQTNEPDRLVRAENGLEISLLRPGE